MAVFGDLSDPKAPVWADMGRHPVLVAAIGEEVVVKNPGREPESTMVFEHETLAMMRAERIEELSKLRTQVTNKSELVIVRKKAGSFWDNITVGRAGTSDIVLADPAISNVHAHFSKQQDGESVALQDLGSSNGTFVNHKQLQPHTPQPLRSGDCIRFGQTVFYLLDSDALKQVVKAPASR